ncbi:MAG: hypothetical protein HZB53_17935 [Chloroflexi bacterium]|nr:hypothetical protein [Chloroflexota bacterium]
MPQNNDQTQHTESQTSGPNGAGLDELDASELRELATELVALMRAELRRERERLGGPRGGR